MGIFLQVIRVTLNCKLPIMVAYCGEDEFVQPWAAALMASVRHVPCMLSAGAQYTSCAMGGMQAISKVTMTDVCLLSMLPKHHNHEGKPPGWVSKALALYHSIFDEVRLLASWHHLHVNFAPQPYLILRA